MRRAAKEKILVVDDEELIRWTLKEALGGWGYTPVEAATVAVALSALETERPVVVLLDIYLPDGSGLELLREIKQRHPETAVIIITANVLVENSVAALRGGAYDFIGKPINLGELQITIRNAIEAQKLRREVHFARRERVREFNFEQLIGESPAMRETINLARKVAQSDVSSVLLQGESGTGKDMLAKAIHYASPRSEAPFVAINCAALPANLIESELFGYEKGAFTDAKARKEGLFEQAEGGTLFLDEIGELELGLQAKLLRVLEEGTFRRVGGLKDLPLNVRVIASSNRNLRAESEDGRFRLDLFYRLSVMQIDIPPLREREDDVLLLAKHFIGTFGSNRKQNIRGLTDEVADAFCRYPWPGNVRELRNLIERAVLLEDGDLITLSYLPNTIQTGATVVTDKPLEGKGPENGPGSSLLPVGLTLDEVETSLVRQAVAQCGGNHTRAAELLGISRDRVRARLRKAEKLGHKSMSDFHWRLPSEAEGGALRPPSERRPIRPDAKQPAGERIAARPDGHPVSETEMADCRHVKEAMHESQVQLAEIIATAMDAIITADQDQRIILFNEAAELMFRCPAAEAKGASLERFIPARFRHRHREHIRRFAQTGESKRRMGSQPEMFGLRADGEEFSLEASISHIDVNGQKLFTVILRDITERKKAEEALRLSEERFVKAFKASPDVMVLSRLSDGTIIEVNDRWQEFFGYSRDEVIGNSSLALNLAEAEDRARWSAVLREKGSVRDYEMQLRPKAGGVRDALLSVETLEINGDLYGLTIIRDITERKCAEEKLREQSLLLDMAQDAILLRALEGKILYWNQGAERLYGWSAREAVGQVAKTLLFKEPPPLLDDALSITLENGEWRGELRQLTKDGGEIMVESRWTLIRSKDNQPQSILVINTDITEKKWLETELLRTARLSLVGEMAAGLAHEIKNPLAGIQGAVDILIERRAPEDAERRTLELVRREVGRIDSTVRALLEKARPHALKLAPASLTEVVRNAVLLARHQAASIAHKKWVNIKYEPPTDPLVLPLDAAQIEDAVLNLVINAVEAIDGEGHVTIRVSRQNSGADSEAPFEEALIRVEDTGRGINENSLQQVFNPFFTESNDGTGLGLAAVRRIARAHGGWVEAKSSLGQGSIFTIHLPFTTAGEN
jgi:two-component system, NtrC family, response regulator AtoC